MHPTYRSINKMEKWMGADRRFIIWGMFMAPALGVQFSSITVSAVIFLAAIYVGRIYAKDPVNFELQFQRQHTLYDAGRSKPFYFVELP